MLFFSVCVSVCVFPTVGCPTLRNLFTSMLLFPLSVTVMMDLVVLQMAQGFGKLSVDSQQVLLPSWCTNGID